MTDAEIRDAVLRALRAIAPEVDPATLAPNLALREQVDLDSMDFLRVLVELQRTLGVEVPETDYARLVALDDWVRYFAGRMARPAPA
jgi:acyl carrier protein